MTFPIVSWEVARGPGILRRTHERGGPGAPPRHERGSGERRTPHAAPAGAGRLGAAAGRAAVRALVAAAAADHDRPARAAGRGVLLVAHRGELGGLRPGR